MRYYHIPGPNVDVGARNGDRTSESSHNGQHGPAPHSRPCSPWLMRSVPAGTPSVGCSSACWFPARARRRDKQGARKSHSRSPVAPKSRRNGAASTRNAACTALDVMRACAVPYHSRVKASVVSDNVPVFVNVEKAPAPSQTSSDNVSEYALKTVDSFPIDTLFQDDAFRAPGNLVSQIRLHARRTPSRAALHCSRHTSPTGCRRAHRSCRTSTAIVAPEGTLGRGMDAATQTVTESAAQTEPECCHPHVERVIRIPSGAKQKGGQAGKSPAKGTPRQHKPGKHVKAGKGNGRAGRTVLRSISNRPTSRQGPELNRSPGHKPQGACAERQHGRLAAQQRVPPARRKRCVAGRRSPSPPLEAQLGPLLQEHARKVHSRHCGASLLNSPQGACPICSSATLLSAHPFPTQPYAGPVGEAEYRTAGPGSDIAVAAAHSMPGGRPDNRGPITTGCAHMHASPSPPPGVLTQPHSFSVSAPAAVPIDGVGAASVGEQTPAGRGAPALSGAIAVPSVGRPATGNISAGSHSDFNTTQQQTLGTPQHSPERCKNPRVTIQLPPPPPSQSNPCPPSMQPPKQQTREPVRATTASVPTAVQSEPAPAAATVSKALPQQCMADMERMLSELERKIDTQRTEARPSAPGSADGCKNAGSSQAAKWPAPHTDAFASSLNSLAALEAEIAAQQQRLQAEGVATGSVSSHTTNPGATSAPNAAKPIPSGVHTQQVARADSISTDPEDTPPFTKAPARRDCTTRTQHGQHVDGAGEDLAHRPQAAGQTRLGWTSSVDGSSTTDVVRQQGALGMEPEDTAALWPGWQSQSRVPSGWPSGSQEDSTPLHSTPPTNGHSEGNTEKETTLEERLASMGLSDQIARLVRDMSAGHHTGSHNSPHGWPEHSSLTSSVTSSNPTVPAFATDVFQPQLARSKRARAGRPGAQMPASPSDTPEAPFAFPPPTAPPSHGRLDGLLAGQSGALDSGDSGGNCIATDSRPGAEYARQGRDGLNATLRPPSTDLQGGGSGCGDVARVGVDCIRQPRRGGGTEPRLSEPGARWGWTDQDSGAFSSGWLERMQNDSDAAPFAVQSSVGNARNGANLWTGLGTGDRDSHVLGGSASSASCEPSLNHLSPPQATSAPHNSQPADFSLPATPSDEHTDLDALLFGGSSFWTS